MPTILLDNVTKVYKNGRKKIPAVQEITLEVEQGDFVFLTGSSGAGVTTLLQLMHGDIKPTKGAVYLNGVNLSRLPKWQSARHRGCFGYLPQESRLKRTETVLHNLSADKPGRMHRDHPNEALIQKALSLVGMSGCEDRYPLEFSIPECKRIELAKAILSSPKILLIDELTDRMDNDTIWDMMHLLNELNKRGTTIIMATHAKQFVNIMRKRVVTLVDGRLAGDVKRGRFGDIV